MARFLTATISESDSSPDPEVRLQADYADIEAIRKKITETKEIMQHTPNTNSVWFTLTVLEMLNWHHQSTVGNVMIYYKGKLSTKQM